jgi:endoglucanase
MKKSRRTRVKFFVVGIGIVAIFALFVAVKNFLLPKLNLFHQNNRVVFIGAWTEGFWDNNSKVLNTDTIKKFEKEINKKIAIAHYFRGWDELDNPQVVKELNRISSNGWVPMISANPYLTKKCSPTTGDIYRSIAVGNCDKLIRDIAVVFKTYGKNMFFRFAWEMNTDSTVWGVQSSKSSPSEFVLAWRHFHNILTENGAVKVKWVFSVNIEKYNSIQIASLYPGDNYVNWTGIDGYNWGTTQKWSRWSLFDEIFHKTYQDLVAVAPNKPVMLSEFNSVSQGGNLSQWFTDALNVQIPNNYQQISAVVFFNEDKSLTEGVDWRIDASPNALPALRNSLQSPIYKSSISD